MARLGFGPRPEHAKLRTAFDINQFMHDAYGRRIDAGTEFFVLIPLDKQNRPIASMVLAEGTEKNVPVMRSWIEEGVRRSKGTHSVIFAHNHPSGNTKPSSADVELANKWANRFAKYGLSLWDSVIVTPNPERYSSWRADRSLWGESFF